MFLNDEHKSAAIPPQTILSCCSSIVCQSCDILQVDDFVVVGKHRNMVSNLPNLLASQGRDLNSNNNNNAVPAIRHLYQPVVRDSSAAYQISQCSANIGGCRPLYCRWQPWTAQYADAPQTPWSANDSLQPRGLFPCSLSCQELL